MKAKTKQGRNKNKERADGDRLVGSSTIEFSEKSKKWRGKDELKPIRLHPVPNKITVEKNKSIIPFRAENVNFVGENDDIDRQNVTKRSTLIIAPIIPADRNRNSIERQKKTKRIKK